MPRIDVSVDAGRSHRTYRSWSRLLQPWPLLSELLASTASCLELPRGISGLGLADAPTGEVSKRSSSPTLHLRAVLRS